MFIVWHMFWHWNAYKSIKLCNLMLYYVLSYVISDCIFIQSTLFDWFAVYLNNNISIFLLYYIFYLIFISLFFVLFI